MVPPTVHDLMPFSENLLVTYRNIIGRKDKTKEKNKQQKPQ